jgi:hypothetical protein
MVDAWIPIQTLDSLTIAPPILSVADSAGRPLLDFSFFSIENNLLRVDTARLRAVCPACRRLVLHYRVLPFDLGAPISRLDTLTIRRRVYADAIEFDYTPYEPSKKPWEMGGLASSGAYTRGLSFGNSQNLVFNSNLNLQLNGKLGNDLELQAALSDNSIPLQPDGTTRQLQEFDRIFIQLKRKNAALTAGDFDLTRPDGYFSNYFKRLQGAMVAVESLKFGVRSSGASIRSSGSEAKDSKVGNQGKIRVAGAVSRGKFARQNIQGQEGNQGPYRLQGAEGERFIIVLAGTEKVFVDGQLLRRGLDDDYVVDYNLGELTFTPRRLVTKDVRIIVEFEYAVQTYLRSTLATNATWNARRGHAYFNLYSEQDSRNNGGAQDLSPAERRRLAETGDNLRNAFASGVDTLADFDAGRILYRAVDSVVCGVPTAILRYSTDPDSARYAARFSEVSPGQGNYVLALTAANGRVFRWSPPDPVTCQPTGNYEPIVRLVAPELRQLYAVGADFQAFRNGRVQAELALSNRDANRFSPLGNGDNVGTAVFVGWRQQFNPTPDPSPEGRGARLSGARSAAPLPSGEGSGVGSRWQGALFANYERTARTFQALNPYRAPEFTRDWNTDASRDTVAEQIGRGGFFLKNKQWGEARYEFGAFRRAGVYDGGRHAGVLRVQKRGWDLMAEGNFLRTDGRAESTRFSRPKLDFSKTFFQKDSTARRAIFKVGIYAEREKNARTAAGADTLARTSFWYDLLRIYFQTPDNQGRWQIGGNVARRNDFAPTGQFFRQNTEASELNLNGAWNNAHPEKPRATSQQLTWTLSLRRLRIVAPELTTQAAQRTYLGRADYNLTAWRNALAFTTGYELGSGQSPRVEFNYLAVNPGEGQYTWVDRNRDSILQVDEMEIAVFQDQASFVRVAVTTPDYVRTNNVLLNQSLRLEPRLLWPTARKGWRRRVGRLSAQSTLQINRRTFASAAGVSPWNPFQADVADTALVTLSAATRHILFVNRADPRWDASLSQGDNRSQLALTTGFEQRRARDLALHGRINFGQRWSVEADGLRGLKSTDNQAFASRDFQIGIWEAGPKATWLPARSFRMVASLKWRDSRNALAGAEVSSQTNWAAELTWNPAAKPNAQGFRAATSLRLKGTFADIRYTGAPNTAVAFAMLEGLQDGKNFLWSLNFDRQISKSVQLNLNYEGRKTGENRVVHVARAQVRAVF